MTKVEPKEIGLERTVWLFEREILEKLNNTNLEDHHKVLIFNRYSMSYEINPEFDNGRADAITMCDIANYWLKMWCIAFATCTADQNKLKSK